MSAVFLFLRHLDLALRLYAAVPTLAPADAYAHAVAASDAASPNISPELLLAVAFVESRYDASATSRVEGATRKTGAYPSTMPPANLAPNSSLYCGPLQTFAPSWTECIALRRLPNAYAAGDAELETWMRDRRVRGDIARALAGHGCGNFGVTTGRCNAYPARVRSVERQLTSSGVGATLASIRRRTTT